jgi:hypothetical protein
MGFFDVFKKKAEVINKVDSFSAAPTEQAKQQLADNPAQASLEPSSGLGTSFFTSGSKGLVLQRCLKCRQKTPMNVLSAKVLQTAKGSKGILYGKCSVCDHSMTMFCKVSDAEEVIKRG